MGEKEEPNRASLLSIGEPDLGPSESAQGDINSKGALGASISGEELECIRDRRALGSTGNVVENQKHLHPTYQGICLSPH